MNSLVKDNEQLKIEVMRLNQELIQASVNEAEKLKDLEKIMLERENKDKQQAIQLAKENNNLIEKNKELEGVVKQLTKQVEEKDDEV